MPRHVDKSDQWLIIWSVIPRIVACLFDISSWMSLSISWSLSSLLSLSLLLLNMKQQQHDIKCTENSEKIPVLDEIWTQDPVIQWARVNESPVAQWLEHYFIVFSSSVEWLSHADNGTSWHDWCERYLYGLKPKEFIFHEALWNKWGESKFLF